MPTWAGKWEGGRYYLDAEGRRVFFIERRAGGVQRSVKLKTHDEREALGELALFLRDPELYCAPKEPKQARELEPVYITTERTRLYMASIHHTVKDHRAARASYLLAWAQLGLDLRTADKRTLRGALATFDGGHRGRVEALNAFARFLVKEGDLPSWNPLTSTRAPEATRAPREAYTLEQLQECYARLPAGPVRDLFVARVCTGMHYTELAQLKGARLQKGLLPDKGVCIRELDGKHAIAGVLQVVHKSRRIHRQSVDAQTLACVLRLREYVPDRVTVWEQLSPLVPSNLRHTFVTLAGEVGELVTYVSSGVDRARIAQVVGHRAGSTMVADRYDRQQVPPMVKLPLKWPAP